MLSKIKKFFLPKEKHTIETQYALFVDEVINNKDVYNKEELLDLCNKISEINVILYTLVKEDFTLNHYNKSRIDAIKAWKDKEKTPDLYKNYFRK